MRRLSFDGWTESQTSRLENQRYCFFGVTETIAAVIGSGLVDAGVGAATAGLIGEGVAGAGLGALSGGALAGVTGGNVAKGLEGGALTGGFIPLGGAIGSDIGIGATAGDIAGGAFGGAIGGAATGQKGFAPALEGAAGGGLAALTAPSGTAPAAGGTATGGPGAGAAATAAPPSVSYDPLSSIQAPSAGGIASSALPAGTSVGSIPSGSIGGASASLPGSALNADVLSSAPAAAPSTGDLGAGIGSIAPQSTAASIGSSIGQGGQLDFSGTPPAPTAANTFNFSPSGGPGAGSASGVDGTAPLGMVNPGDSASALTSGGVAGSNSPGLVQQALTGIGVGQTTAADLGKIAPYLAPAGILGGEALLGQQQPKGYNQILGTANQLSAQGSQLESYLTHGTLPPGVQDAVNAASSEAVTAIKAKYAAAGQSGSSAEATDIAAAQENAVTQGTQIALQLMQSGVQESNLSSQLYDSIMKTATTQDQSLSNALASFSAGLIPKAA